MNRRKLLKGMVVAGATVAAWPAWLSKAFGAACEKVRPARSLPAALERARALGKPLLVLVVPADEKFAYVHGAMFGIYLNSATPAQLWPTALAELACAKAAAVASELGVKVPGDPQLILIETSGKPEVTTRQFPACGHSDLYGEKAEQTIDAVIARVAEAVRTLVARDVAMLARRASESRAALGETQSKLVEVAIAAHDIDPESAFRGAALIAQRGAADVRDRVLGEAVHTRLKLGPPAGSHWANNTCCGTWIEGVREDVAIGCGMGQVPARSRRLLWFLSKTPFGKPLDP